jgi:hypothetical protein
MNVTCNIRSYAASGIKHMAKRRPRRLPIRQTVTTRSAKKRRDTADHHGDHRRTPRARSIAVIAMNSPKTNVHRTRLICWIQ